MIRIYCLFHSSSSLSSLPLSKSSAFATYFTPMCIINLVKLLIPSFVLSPPQLASTNKLKKSLKLICCLPSKISAIYSSLNLIFLSNPNCTNAAFDKVLSSPTMMVSEVAHANTNYVLRSSKNSPINFVSTSLNF